MRTCRECMYFEAVQPVSQYGICHYKIPACIFSVEGSEIHYNLNCAPVWVGENCLVFKPNRPEPPAQIS